MADLKITKGETKHWQNRITVARKIQGDKCKAWASNVERYSSRMKGSPRGVDSDPGSDIVRVNMLFANVQTKLPALIFQNPDITALPRNPETTREKRLMAEAGLRYYIDEWDLKTEVEDCVLDALLKDYGCLTQGWSIRTWDNQPPVDRDSESEKNEDPGSPLGRMFRNIPKMFGEEGKKQTTEDPVEDLRVAHEGPVVFRVAPEYILHHPDASFPADKGCRWLAHVTKHTVGEMMYDRRFPKDWRKGLKPAEYLDPKYLKAVSEDRDPTKIDDPDMQFIVLYTIWDRIARRKLVYAENNWDKGPGLATEWPFLGMEGFPFEFLVFNKIPDRFEGITEIDPVLNQFEELDAMRTYQIRHMKRVSNRMYIRTNQFKEGTDELLRAGRDGTVLTTDADDATGQMVPLQDASISRDFYQAQVDVKEDINQIQAVSEYNKGRVAGAESATEAAAIIEGARERASKSKNKVDDFTLKSIRKAFQIMQQCMSTELAVKIAGPAVGGSWRKMTKEDIAGEWDIKLVPETSSPPNREQLRAHALAVADKLAGSELVDQRELILLFLQQFPELMAGGVLDRLVKDPEEANEIRQELAGLMGGGGQIPQGGPVNAGA